MKQVPTWTSQRRSSGLRRFAAGITALTVLGHFALGFEAAWAHPLVGLAAAYATELVLESVAAWSQHRHPRFWGGTMRCVDFLLPAHIAGLAVSMLLYANSRLWPIAFAATTAVASKAIFRLPIRGTQRHVFNPSNFGIALTLVLFPWMCIAPAYQFTENVAGALDWTLVGAFFAWGIVLNATVSGRLPLITAWLFGFALQAWARSILFGTPLTAGLIPMTGAAFILFTFYMLPDPATTPMQRSRQIVFGLSVSAAYGVLMMLHVVFALFFALTIVCGLRGVMAAAGSLRWRHHGSSASASTTILQEAQP